MKKLLFIVLLLPWITRAQDEKTIRFGPVTSNIQSVLNTKTDTAVTSTKANMKQTVMVVPTIDSLTKVTPDSSLTYIAQYIAVPGDNGLSMFRWSPTDATSKTDSVFYSYVKSQKTTGSFVRFINVGYYRVGTNITNGKVTAQGARPKTTWVLNQPGLVTDANGQIVLNLTKDNSTNGPAIYSAEPYQINTDIIGSGTYSIVRTNTTNSLKQITFTVTKPVASVLSLGVPIFVAAPGVTINFEIQGE